MATGRSATAQAVAELLGRSGDSSAGKGGEPAEHWNAFVTAGLPWAAVAAERGGPDGGVDDAADILREVGRAGVAAPAGDCDLLGEWLLSKAGLPSVTQLAAVAPAGATDDLKLRRQGSSLILSGTANRVPWASSCERFIALVPGESDFYVISLAMNRLAVSPGTSLAGEERATVSAADLQLGPDEARSVNTLQPIDFRARGAAIRTLLIQGAVHAVVELVETFCSTRMQFGRQLRDFQVMGHQIALLREQTALINAAAESALGVLRGSDSSWEEAAAAKIVAGEVATLVAKTAHQMHGAIGVTEEYALQRFTRRLWSWRDEYGGEQEWATRLGATLIARGSDALWPWMTDSLTESR